MPRTTRPYRHLEGKPQIPDPAKPTPHGIHWSIHSENAITSWLHDNRAAIRELTGQQPLYVLNTSPDGAAIDIMPDRRGRLVIRYQVGPDGVLTSSGPSNRPIMQDWDIPIRQFFTETAADLWDECVRRIPSNYANRLLFLDDNTAGDRWRPRIITTITKEVRGITDHALRYAVVNGESLDTSEDTRLAAINKPLRRYFAKPQIVRLARRCCAPGRHVGDYDSLHPVTVAEYNFANRYRSALEQTLEHNSNAVIWYAAHHLKQGLRIPAGKLDPARIVDAARQDLDLHTRARWHTFLSLPAEHIKRDPERLPQAIAILVQANPDDNPYSETGQARRNTVMYCLSVLRPTLDRQWSHGDPTARWAQICGAFLRHGKSGEQILMGMRNLTDAFIATVTDDAPWPDSGDYDAHLRKSQRWHTARQQQRYLELARQAPLQSWPALITAHDSDDRKRRCFPLNTPFMLVQAGNAMANCLASFATRCQTGNTAVFAFVETANGGDPQAAASLHRDSEQAPGRLGQVAGHYNAKAPDWAREWAQELVTIANTTEAPP